MDCYCDIYALYNEYIQINQVWTSFFSWCSQCLYCCFGQFFFVQPSRWSLAGGSTCCSHQTGGWTPAYTVATLPGHNYLQLTPIEFQDRGLNPGPLEPVDSKTNCYSHQAVYQTLSTYCCRCCCHWWPNSNRL